MRISVKMFQNVSPPRISFWRHLCFKIRKIIPIVCHLYILRVGGSGIGHAQNPWPATGWSSSHHLLHTITWTIFSCAFVPWWTKHKRGTPVHHTSKCAPWSWASTPRGPTKEAQKNVGYKKKCHLYFPSTITTHDKEDAISDENDGIFSFLFFSDVGR